MKKERSQYFQEIAHHFIAERGAPFFLSSVDIELILSWEKMKIPLGVVLEGMKKAFQNRRAKSGEKRKVRTLVSCQYHVLREFEQYRERRVGKMKNVRRDKRKEKRRMIRREVENFLASIPSEVVYLEEIYSRAMRLLSRKDVDEDELEKLDRKVEDFLSDLCSREEKDRVKEEVLKEYPSAGEEDLLSLVKIKTIKLLRERYRIPYLSFYYY